MNKMIRRICDSVVVDEENKVPVISDPSVKVEVDDDMAEEDGQVYVTFKKGKKKYSFYYFGSDSEGWSIELESEEPDWVTSEMFGANHYSTLSELKSAYEAAKKKAKVGDAREVEGFDEIRALVGDKAVVDELQQYMSTDDLEEFVDHLKTVFDID